MTSLPMQPTSELPTRDDIARFEQRIDTLAAEMRDEHNQIHKALRTQLVATIGAMTALTGIFSLITLFPTGP